MKTCLQCGGKHYAKNLCRNCYSRERRGSKPIAPMFYVGKVINGWNIILVDDKKITLKCMRCGRTIERKRYKELSPRECCCFVTIDMMKSFSEVELFDLFMENEQSCAKVSDLLGHSRQNVHKKIRRILSRRKST